MRAERLGSYSIVATLPGTPYLSRLKSIRRSFCLCPPPWWRMVRSPVLRRPPVRFRTVSSGLCGVSAVMPLAAPIGSGMGVQNSANLRIMRETITAVPLIVDAGVGTASDAAIAMELGADGVLMNTAIAAAEDSASMAKAMKLAVEAGRLAYLAGRMPKKLYASASSPLVGVVGQAS